MKPHLTHTWEKFASAGIREPGKVNEPWPYWMLGTLAMCAADIILWMIEILSLKTCLIVGISVVGFGVLMFGLALFSGKFCKVGRGIGNE